MTSFRATTAKAILIVMGLGSTARADDLQTIVDKGKLCPLLFDLVNGGQWRGLTPTLNDLFLWPDFTFTTTGLS